MPTWISYGGSSTKDAKSTAKTSYFKSICEMIMASTDTDNLPPPPFVPRPPKKPFERCGCSGCLGVVTRKLVQPGWMGCSECDRVFPLVS
eukprot:g81907.t1